MPAEELGRYIFLVTFLTIVLAPIIWLFSRRQRILDDTFFTYSNGYAKSSVAYEKIAASDIRIMVKKYPDTVWEFLLNDQQIVSIPISHYSRNDLQVFAGTLISKSNTANHATLVYELAQGKFPWYIK